MFEGFNSTQDILDVMADTDTPHVRRQMDAIDEIRDRLTSSGEKNEVEALQGIARRIIGDDVLDHIAYNNDNIADMLREMSNEAILEGPSGPYRDIITAFISDLGLSKRGAKNIDSSVFEVESTGLGSDDQRNPTPPSNGLPGQLSQRHHESQKGTTDFHQKKNAIPDTSATASPSFVCPQDTIDHAPFSPLDDYEGEAIINGWDGNTGEGRERIANGELMKLPGILPPPPACGSGEQYGKWLEGEIFHPLNFTIKIHLGEEDNADDLIEMLSEFHALPEGACQTYSARDPVDPCGGEDKSMRLFYASKDLGFQGHTLDMAAQELSRSVMKYFEEYEPVSAEFLTRAGFDVKCDPKLAVIIASALDIEKFFIENGPEGAGEGSIHDIRGAISPDSRLDVRHILDRAMFSYFSLGLPLSDTMHQSLNEFRHAQLCRHLGRDITTTEFDAAYNQDWFLELDAYRIEQEATPEMG